ncbi:MAG: Calx-beta domain-containing protein [Candidatus Peregrinibacteria bacterium]
MEFASDASDTPILDSVNVAFGGIPDVSFQSGSLVVSEADGIVTLSLTLTESSPLQISVPYTISGASTATLDSDYGVITGSPLILAPGETSTGIILNLTDDALGEDSETIILTLGDPTNATLGSTGTLTLTLTSDDTPEVSFQSGSLTLSETSGTVSVTLTLSGSSARDITIPFSFGGTATGTGSDYTILTPSPLVLEGGETSTGVILQLIDDSSVESNKTIILTLGSPTNAEVGGTGTITITLTSDDVAPASSSSSSAQAQAGGGTGGRRGSTTQMATRIAQAQTTILARFEGKRQQSERLVADEEQRTADTRLLAAQQRKAAQEDRAAVERESRIAKRIEEYEISVAQIAKQKEELQRKFEQHREERYARALEQEEQQLAKSQAALLAEQDALKNEQETNRLRREERLTEKDQRIRQQLLAQEEEAKREALAAKEREDRIAQRIAEHEISVALIQKKEEELQQKYEQYREERYAQALEQEQQRLAESERALQDEQRALVEEQERNGLRRAQRLAEREELLKEQEEFALETPPSRSAASPLRLSNSAETIAARRDRLYAFVDETPVIYMDVPLSAWYAPYVSYVIEEKIATGYADEAGKPTGEFGVENPITYAEVLKMAMQASAQAFDLKGLPPPRNTSAKGTWASAYVAKAESLQLSVFSVQRNVMKSASRGAVIQTILEVLGIPTGPKAETSYSDVPASHPYARAIAMATYLELVSGDKDASGNSLGTFRPDDPINRAEVAKIIALAKELLK